MIDGAGLFMLRKDGDTYYPRAGQFEFDRDGMVDQANGARVSASTATGNSATSRSTGLRASPPKATARAKFTATCLRRYAACAH